MQSNMRLIIMSGINILMLDTNINNEQTQIAVRIRINCHGSWAK